ncbi:nucleoside 2-deoxyribosyltransferase [Janthinobacterium sp. MP5059B]|uniref:PfkB family carbohydrate kinase n=1 Tax=Janthinobacterium sp. MP5059B TaxID=1766683 RepID=UPI0008940FF0|nr:PfkB family carbohydrate kinase [Janthinobacterium sp. MP5059B]OEZ49276.1 nucleoside 2-deoxyribosyltransferase [Janthinobacterium sp. MP5059B]
MKTLKIAGGIYREICQFPERREILGSGGRAAAALDDFDVDVQLHAFVPDSHANEVRLNLANYNFELCLSPGKHLISFRWLHGLASPQQEPLLGIDDLAGKLDVKGDLVLRYGMVEGSAVVDAEVAVYDPQAPLHAKYFTENGSKARRLAYVINSVEAKLLTGSDDPSQQLSTIHRRENAAVVVLKQGPHGALVSDGINVRRVPCYKTENVWSIGSGDVFSATFTYFWGAMGLPADEAAYRASLATAFYCNSAYLPVPVDFDKAPLPPPCVPTTSSGEKRTIYLAGPFFTVSQRWLVDSLRETFLKLNIDVFSPIHDAGEGDPDVVAREDLLGIDKCDVLFAICDGLDSGTIFEVGYAIATRKPVVAFTQVENKSDLTMLTGTGCLIESDLDTAIYRAIWIALER